MKQLEVSFNSPQCGWMSIGFDDGVSEFHTTTASAPHERALPELLEILKGLLTSENFERKLEWNRVPEAFDFVFSRNNEKATIQIFQYPTETRDSKEREKVFEHNGKPDDICRTFAETFKQLYEDRNTDEFEFNWRQPFPEKEFREFTKLISSRW